jgi:16S rRNA (guanine966-N2)-methyltransferase
MKTNSREDRADNDGIIRISSGSLKGRPVNCPQTGGVRPMLNRTRMAMFNVLADKLQDAVVWDCFAGSGLLGFETISRGAKYCVFIERDAAHAKVIIGNIESLKLRDATSLIRGSAFDLLKTGIARLPHTPADIVLLDPPHAMIEDAQGPFWPWLRGLRESPLVADGTIVAIGHPAGLAFPDSALRVADSRTYGTVAFTLLTP